MRRRRSVAGEDLLHDQQSKKGKERDAIPQVHGDGSMRTAPGDLNDGEVVGALPWSPVPSHQAPLPSLPTGPSSGIVRKMIWGP